MKGARARVVRGASAGDAADYLVACHTRNIGFFVSAHSKGQVTAASVDAIGLGLHRFTGILTSIHDFVTELCSGHRVRCSWRSEHGHGPFPPGGERGSGRRAGEAGVAEGEDPAVGRREPVAAAVR